MKGDYSIGSRKWNGLSKIQEETAELNVILGKLVGCNGNTNHWSGNLANCLIDELADTQASLEYFIEKNMGKKCQQKIAKRKQKKLDLYEQWNKSDDD